MKVSKPGTIGKAGKTKPKKISGQSSDFIKNLEAFGETAKTSNVVDAGGVQTVSAAFALQEIKDSTDHPSRGVLIKRSADLLDQLDGIRMGILAGNISKERLTALGRQLRQKRAKSDDPKLNNIIEEIELRAEVEVAKLSRPLK